LKFLFQFRFDCTDSFTYFSVKFLRTRFREIPKSVTTGGSIVRVRTGGSVIHRASEKRPTRFYIVNNLAANKHIFIILGVQNPE